MAERLSLLSDSDESEPDLKVNRQYADSYNKWRNKEELQKLKDLSKDISDTSSESEEEEEPDIEEEFLKTLSLLKSKDPKIYDGQTTFFDEDHSAGKTQKKTGKKAKPMYMKDYERTMMLEGKAELSSDEEEHIPTKGPTMQEELEETKRDFKKAGALSDDSDSEQSEEDFLTVRNKTKEEQELDNAEHLEWLKGKKDHVSGEKEMSFLRKYWNDPDLDADEKFLRDFILDKKYTKGSKSDAIPTYDEVTAEELERLNEDEEELHQQETFEHKYNFRFEEPDQEFIKRYPRTVGDSLRREDNKRKLKREEYADRKKKEKEVKKEELKRLKALKRKEIEEKFFKLKEVSGKDEINFDEDDIESDFDPDKHDQKMKELFDDEYYDVEEVQKPEFVHDEEIDDENWDHWVRKDLQGNKSNVNLKAESLDQDVSEDESVSDVNPKESFAQEMIQTTHSRKKSKKKSLFAKIISEPKPIYDPTGKPFEEYLDEYYKLDCEDIVADIPVRFKYRKVVPNGFGLTVDEILSAHDKELNQWCSVKKASQYRREEEEIYDVQAFNKKAQNLAVKQKVLASVYLKNADEEKKSGDENDSIPKTANGSGVNDSQKKKRRKKKKKKDQAETNSSHTSIKIEADPIKCPTEKDSESEERGAIPTNANDSEKGKRKKEKKKHVESRSSHPSFKIEVNPISSQAKQDCESSHAETKSFVQKLSKTFSPTKKIKREQQSDSMCRASMPMDVSVTENAVSGNQQKKRKRKRKNKSGKNAGGLPQIATRNNTKDHLYRSNKKPKLADDITDKRLAISNDRLAAYGINPKKFKNKIKYSKKNDV